MSRMVGAWGNYQRKRTVLHSILLCSLYGTIFAATWAAAAEPVQVAVTGIEGVALENVQASLNIPPDTVHDGEVNLPWLERFARQVPERVQKALEPFGYYNARVTTKLESADARSYIVRVHVEPGMPVIVADVSIEIRGAGAQEEPLSGLGASFPLKKGDVLNQSAYEATKDALKAHALERGYLDADYTEHRILISRGEARARIELVLETGPRYFFGEVSFAGAEDYPDMFLKRYLAFKERDAFSPAELSATQLNLINSDRFRDVIISPEKEKARDFLVPVTIRLEPSFSKRLRFGAGYGTDTGARGTVNYKDLNVFDRGHEIEKELDIAQNVQGFAAGYRIPGGNVDSFTGLRVKLQREDTSTYVSKLISLEINRIYGFGQGRIGTAYVDVQKEDSDVAGETVNARLVLPGLRFSQQRYDNLIRPEKGYRYEFELRGTDRFLGSDVGLIQVLGEGKMIVSFLERLSLVVRAQGAATFAGNTLVDLPASLRFFTGGSNSVRGYSYQSLGPQDAAGNVVGGRHLLVGSLEVERAILKDWGAAAFYDVGNAFNIPADMILFQGAGVGVRYYTPVGALRLDIARQIGVENPGFHLHFTLGFQL